MQQIGYFKGNVIKTSIWKNTTNGWRREGEQWWSS